MSKKLYLSYIIDKNTPTYGNRNRFIIEQKSSIAKGDVANDSFIQTTVHIGTHIDMPYHFYKEGQTIEDFEVNFFNSDKVLFVELQPKGTIIKNDLIDILEKIENKKDYKFLIVKTGICHEREEEIFWKENYGFHLDIARYLKENLPNIRVFGFDSISVSSFASRMLGREAHKAFLDPTHPILLLEDMDLTKLSQNSKILNITIAPLRISNCDGLPCTVIAEVENG